MVCEVLVRLSCADNRVGGDWAGREICGEEPAGRCWCCQTSKCFLLGVLTEMSREMHEVGLLTSLRADKPAAPSFGVVLGEEQAVGEGESSGIWNTRSQGTLKAFRMISFTRNQREISFDDIL